MNICTPELAAVGSAPRPVTFFEAPRRETELRPVASLTVESSTTPGQHTARAEKQALCFAFALGVAALLVWGVLLYTLATNLQPPSLL